MTGVSRKFGPLDEALIYANLHLNTKEIGQILNSEREKRDQPPVDFTRYDRQNFKKKNTIEQLKHDVPELEVIHRCRMLKFHKEKLQGVMDGLIGVEGEEVTTSQAREISSLSREFRQTLHDIGALEKLLAVHKKTEKPVEEKPPEEKYRDQLPENAVEFKRKADGTN